MVYIKYKDKYIKYIDKKLKEYYKIKSNKKLIKVEEELINNKKFYWIICDIKYTEIIKDLLLELNSKNLIINNSISYNFGIRPIIKKGK